MDHEHDWKLLAIVDQMREANVGHYRCTICNAIMVRPKGNETMTTTIAAEGGRKVSGG